MGIDKRLTPNMENVSMGSRLGINSEEISMSRLITPRVRMPRGIWPFDQTENLRCGVLGRIYGYLKLEACPG
jgi:hypothetical protein